MRSNTPAEWLHYSLVIFILLTAFVFPQTERANYKILGITVEGNKSADANTIIANSGLKIGDEIEVPGDQTNNAIKRLWNLNIFSDVQIIADKIVGNGVFLQIKISEYPRLETVVLDGNDELDEDDIMKEVNVIKGQVLKTYEIYKIISKIKKLYDEEGYLNAKITYHYYTFVKADTTDDDEITVTWHNKDDFSDEYENTYEFDPDAPSDIIRKIKDRVLLKFDFDEGDEIVVRKIEFYGNEAFDDDDLKSEFDETTESRWWRFWSGSHLNKEDYKKDKELLGTFYRKNGYRDFEILKDSLEYSDDLKDVNIYISVYEGPQYKLRDIKWVGNTVYPDEILSAHLNFQKGDVYDYEKFTQNLRGNEAQTDVSSLYYDTGYLTFALDPREKRIGNDSIDVEIRITENNRFKVGRVNITGNDKTKDKVIRRELYSIPGEYFSRSFIFRSLQQLANLQYFNVEQLYKEGVDYKPVNDSTVGLTYKVEEKSSDYLNASVGYSGAYGFSGSIGVTLTNFSITEPFQLGGGQVLNFSWQFGVGNYYRTFTLGFTEPWFNDTPTSVGFDLFDTRQNYIYDLQQSGITFRVGRRLSWPDNYFSVQGKIGFQYNDVKNGQGYYTEGLSRQYTLGATISRIDIDNPVFPSKGSRISLSGEISGGPFLPGNVDYYKLELNTELYKSLFNSSRFVLYTSANLGFIDKLKSGTPIQPFEYFYMGGNGLVIATVPLRGYEDRSIGPLDPSTGYVLGGKIMAKYTAELRVALALEPIPIYLLAFAEAGNTYLSVKQTDLFDLKRSAGLGARLMINPIGLVGFDYGYGFDRRSVDGNDPQWVFHFQFGKGF